MTITAPSDRRVPGSGLRAGSPPGGLAASLLAVGLLALAIAWAGSNPPGASPDEPAHLVKAYTTGAGQWSGDSYESGDADLSDDRALAWFEESGRTYRLPAPVVPPDTVACFAFDSGRTADCQRFETGAGDDGAVAAPTHVGRYNPLLYVPAGLAMQGSDDFRAAIWRGRLVNVVLSGAFIAWAAGLCVRSGGRYALAGLAVAVTPMVLFLSASVTTNGIETASASCLWAALLALRRRPDDRSLHPWLAVGIAGAVLALSRPLGAALLAAIVSVWVVLVGADGVRELWLRARSRMRPVALALSAAFVASAAYSAVAMAHPPLDLGLAARSLGRALGDLPDQVRQSIGVFGWSDTALPLVAYVWGLAPFVFLGLAAVRRGGDAERRALVLLAAGTVVADVAIAVLVEAQIGFGMQARYVLPLTVGLPLLAGDVVAHPSRPRVPEPPSRSWAPATIVAAIAVLHAVALLANAHRYAVGADASWLPPWDTAWSPVGGLTIWLAFATLGAGSLLASAVLLRPGVPVPDTEPEDRRPLR